MAQAWEAEFIAPWQDGVENTLARLWLLYYRDRKSRRTARPRPNGTAGSPGGGPCERC
jgi:hypothetical protein